MTPEDAFREISDRILQTADAEPGMQAIEEDLIRLTALLQSRPDDRAKFVERLVALMDPAGTGDLPLYTPGVIEILEFTMHQLRWSEVADALAVLRDEHSDLRVQRQAERGLDAFADHWPTGEIYATYRAG